MMPTLHPHPWTHVGNGQVQDANGLPVLWVCHDQAFGFTPECLAASELAARGPELLEAALHLVRRLASLAGTPAARHLPPDVWVLAGRLAGHAALAGGDITPERRMP